MVWVQAWSESCESIWVHSIGPGIKGKRGIDVEEGLRLLMLVERTRAMLLDAKLPQSFWAEAVSTATYLRNRSPTSAVEGMPPHQSWYGCKPGVNHVKVFGYTA